MGDVLREAAEEDVQLGGSSDASYLRTVSIRGSSLVERLSEEQGVDSSILSLGTIYKYNFTA